MSLSTFLYGAWDALIALGHSSPTGWIYVWGAVAACLILLFAAIDTGYRLLIHFVRVWQMARRASLSHSSRAEQEETQRIIQSYYPRYVPPTLSGRATKGFSRDYQATVVPIARRRP